MDVSSNHTIGKSCHKQNIINIQNFYDVILPYNFMAKILGFFSCTLEEPSSNHHQEQPNNRRQPHYRTTVLDIILFILNVGLHLVLLYKQVVIQPIIIKLPIVEIGGKLVLMYSTCIAIVAIVIVFGLRNKIVGAIVKMHAVDLEVNVNVNVLFKLVYNFVV